MQRLLTEPKGDRDLVGWLVNEKFNTQNSSLLHKCMHLDVMFEHIKHEKQDINIFQWPPRTNRIVFSTKRILYDDVCILRLVR